MDIYGPATGDDTIRGGYGNDFLYGSSGRDTLEEGEWDDFLFGESGIDKMIVGNGNDTYYVDDPKDILKEIKNGGNDILYTIINFILPKYIETLYLVEGYAINAKGNKENNFLFGNNEDNVINGAGGDDILIGKGGSDTLIGGRGGDPFWLTDYDGINLIASAGFSGHQDETLSK